MQTKPRAASAGTVTDSFVSSVPYTGRRGETLVIYCTDPRFRKQTHELLTSLGVEDPFVYNIPGGPASLVPIVGFAHKAMKPGVDAVIGNVKRVVLVAHEDCAAYRSEHKVLNRLVTAVLGANVQKIQERHLSEAASLLRTWYPHVTIECFIARLVSGETEQRVKFDPIT
jgi:carbonic anhydrase